ncbi:MAG: phenylalanine--tRNA ligase subunit alpha [Kiritimatiellaeota bacterium]|nr:phenylalanine--tRNA ligase subunit alpha [Kiritimatiellota bacterium]
MAELAREFEALEREAVDRFGAVRDVAELEQMRVRYLGRRGRIPGLLGQMRDVSPQDRPAVGRAANHAKRTVQEAFEAARRRLSRKDSEAAATGLDVTLPGRRRRLGHAHPITQIMDESVAIFRRLGFVVADGPDIETEYYNFDALNTPSDHPSRDIQDTFYLPDGRLLRTQTSPVQVRVMERQAPPVRIVCPGRCFRRDTPDATHSMNFHQIEGLYVNRRVSLADLKADLTLFAKELLGPDVRVRFRPHFFPFTEPSIEYDFSCIMCGGTGCRVCKNSGWLEISGAGMVDPAVFEAVGYDPEQWTGYAFGMGLERIAMIRFAVDDIRLLYENDVRFLHQF